MTLNHNDNQYNDDKNHDILLNNKIMCTLSTKALTIPLKNVTLSTIPFSITIKNATFSITTLSIMAHNA